MGRTGSSSKRKSSKYKIPKSSSEARRKKKSRKNKSKKLRRRDDSVSSYSDDESTSSLSLSSEDDYKSRKAQSRARGDLKGSRKRIRSSSSPGSSIDSPRVKKIKRVKRNGDSETRKRCPKKKSNTKKNKRRRDASISSVSSDTHSCSTCQVGSSSSSEERETERLRGRLRERKKETRHSGKARNEAKKSRDRSRSCSSCKLSDSIGNNSIENFTVENNSRRLRSVITIAPRVEDSIENEENKDECKEEIVYDHDDYPSCRSNDSNDGGNRRDSSHRRVENLMGEVSSVSNLITAKPASTSNNSRDKYDVLNHISDGAGNVSPKEKEANVKDLESILRQRALENLKKFGGVCQTNEVVPVDERNKSNSEMKPVATVTAAVVQNNELTQVDLTALPQSAARRNRFTWRRDSSLPMGTEENIPPETVRRTVASLPDSSISGGFEERDINLASGKGSESVRSQTSRLQELRANSLLNSSSVNKRLDGNSHALIESTSNSRGLGISDGHGSTPPDTPSSVLSEEGSSKKQENEAKDSSQFQQKTMSVMRGGEMVQVSYKVYIPKKVPALARRQLKR